MGIGMADTANTVYRDFVSDGVPSSGKNRPKKPDIRRLLTGYETIINAFTSNGGLIYTSKATMDADLAHGAKSSAWVIGDATVANNGVYQKQGASGTGSWTRVADLPFSFIIASDAGAGTANAIQATTSIPVSGSALVWSNVFEANTASPVTISFNGGSALTIKTNSGNDVAIGGLTAGMIVLGIVSGSTFRLLNDQVSSAIVAAAEAAQAAAEAAQVAAEAAAAEAETLIGLVITAIQSKDYLWGLDAFSGAIGPGNDYSLKIEQAIANEQTWALPPKQVGVSQPIVLKTGTEAVGANFYKSVIKLLDGSNCNIFESEGAAGYFSTPPSSGSPAVVPHKISLRNFRVDGNRANNTSGHLFYLFCRHHFIEQIFAQNIPQAGCKIKYNDNGAGAITPGGPGANGMESMLRNIYFDYIGEDGLVLEGVHDSVLENIFVVHASQKANNTYDGIRMLTGWTGRCRNIHVYNSGTVANHRYGLYDETGSELTDCHLEGAATHNALIAGQRGKYSGLYLYATRSPATRNLVVTGNEHMISGRLGGKAMGSDPNCVGLTLGLSSGDFASGNIIDLQVIDQNAGSIDWTYSDGDNLIRMRGEQSTGPKQLGTRQPSDRIDAIVSGVRFGGANNITATGSTLAGATQLTAKTNRITGGAAGTGIILPPSASYVDDFVAVTNITGSTKMVYPNGADIFDNGAVGAPITIPANKNVMFFCSFAGTWSPVISA